MTLLSPINAKHTLDSLIILLNHDTGLCLKNKGSRSFEESFISDVRTLPLFLTESVKVAVWIERWSQLLHWNCLHNFPQFGRIG